jgi:hypothetical protein
MDSFRSALQAAKRGSQDLDLGGKIEPTTPPKIAVLMPLTMNRIFEVSSALKRGVSG